MKKVRTKKLPKVVQGTHGQRSGTMICIQKSKGACFCFKKRWLTDLKRLSLRHLKDKFSAPQSSTGLELILKSWPWSRWLLTKHRVTKSSALSSPASIILFRESLLWYNKLWTSRPWLTSHNAISIITNLWSTSLTILDCKASSPKLQLSLKDVSLRLRQHFNMSSNSFPPLTQSATVRPLLSSSLLRRDLTSTLRIRNPWTESLPSVYWSISISWAERAAIEQPWNSANFSSVLILRLTPMVYF